MNISPKMPFIKKEHTQLIALLVFLLNVDTAQSQTTIGKENLDINNGTLYANYYKTVNNTHSYLNSEVFENGNVVYENQTYNDVVLNYDVFKDDLLMKPSGVNDRRSVILTPQKIQSFTFSGKTFVNLSYNKTATVDFVKGFYEENFISRKFTFFIKHNKEKRELTSEGKIYDSFKVKNDFVLYFKNKFYDINSKRNITDIFPEVKSQIEDYYLLNNKVEESNKTEFMESLLRHINAILK
jgi:hypothetical protein